MSGIRVFVAVNPPEAVHAEVRRRQRELQALPGSEAVRWVEPALVHLTLRFLGDIPADAVADVSEAVRQATAGAVAFEVALQGLGCFPRPQAPRVFWIGIRGAMQQLQELAEAVRRETAAWGKPESRVFQPHLTIGRVASDRVRSASRLANALSGISDSTVAQWAVKQVEVMQSRLLPSGAEYTVLDMLPLAAGPSVA